jgi:hypothetical protein
MLVLMFHIQEVLAAYNESTDVPPVSPCRRWTEAPYFQPQGLVFFKRLRPPKTLISIFHAPQTRSLVDLGKGK